MLPSHQTIIFKNMKLLFVATVALADETVNNTIGTLLLGNQLQISNKYEFDHVHCDKNDLPTDSNKSLECEILDQHTVCYTACENAKRIEFECDCNRKFMTISIFDKNSCHWNKIMNAPCREPDYEAEAPSIAMLHDVSIPLVTSPPEEIEYESESYDEIERFEPFGTTTVHNTKQNENNTESISNITETSTDTPSTQSDKKNNERHLTRCTKLDKSWNCSNKNSRRYSNYSLV